MYGLGNSGGTPGGRLGGAFPTEKEEKRKVHLGSNSGSRFSSPPRRFREVPDVVATELRVEAVTVELLPRLRPRLETLLRLEETLTTGGAAATVLEDVEKVLAEEWRLDSLSTLVCWGREGRVRAEILQGVVYT